MDLQGTSTRSSENEDGKDHVECSKLSHKPDWLKKCITKFSLYANLIVGMDDDPYDDEVNKRDFKPKLSKSTKKRLRRQKKKRLALSAKSVQVKKPSPQVIKKQTRKDLKMIMKRLSAI